MDVYSVFLCSLRSPAQRTTSSGLRLFKFHDHPRKQVNLTLIALWLRILPPMGERPF